MNGFSKSMWKLHVILVIIWKTGKCSKKGLFLNTCKKITSYYTDRGKLSGAVVSLRKQKERAQGEFPAERHVSAQIAGQQHLSCSSMLFPALFSSKFPGEACGDRQPRKSASMNLRDCQGPNDNGVLSQEEDNPIGVRVGLSTYCWAKGFLC